MKKDTFTQLITDMLDELTVINDQPIKPSKKLRKLRILETKAKMRYERLKCAI